METNDYAAGRYFVRTVELGDEIFTIRIDASVELRYEPQPHVLPSIVCSKCGTINSEMTVFSAGSAELALNRASETALRSIDRHTAMHERETAVDADPFFGLGS